MHSAPQFSRDSRLLPVPGHVLPLSSKCPVCVDCGGWEGGSGELLRSLQAPQEMIHTMLALADRSNHVPPRFMHGAWEIRPSEEQSCAPPFMHGAWEIWPSAVLCVAQKGSSTGIMVRSVVPPVSGLFLRTKQRGFKAGPFYSLCTAHTKTVPHRCKTVSSQRGPLLGFTQKHCIG